MLAIFASVAMISGANAQSSEKAFQLSFISPIGTNGTQANEIINDYSLNLLGGHSRGNNVLELGGLYNVNTSYTKGVQFAGLTNYSAKSEKAVQFAGITNIASDQDRGVQISGITNVTAKGNVAFQLSGILNVADKAGTQIGLINIADSVGGTSIGLINIVKKNGKKEFEIGFSDALHTYGSFKLGTDKFYTIFSAGVNYINQTDDLQYAVGLGFGKDIALKNNFATQIELLGYGLSEGQEFTSDLNMLTQLKVTGSKEFKSGVKVFAGPVLNMTVSKYQGEDGELIGSQLAPYTLFESNNGNVDLKGWIGFTFGIRY
ncbi:hypothetical protein BC781_101563 [Sediminitomix flava]|uniref:Uncharacterized protein n=2 Tax=Sediminitomix flava TaxID=379075 RepID=A0A315ZGD5_SEDFL|nr:hypothetical protein BC781_101563 [Sediminitomix flava]